MKADIIRLQQHLGVEADGIIGRQTLCAISSALGIVNTPIWPTQSGVRSGTSIFGAPRCEDKLTSILPAYQLYYDGKPVRTIRVHHLIAPHVREALRVSSISTAWMKSDGLGLTNTAEVIIIGPPSAANRSPCTRGALPSTLRREPMPTPLNPHAPPSRTRTAFPGGRYGKNTAPFPWAASAISTGCIFNLPPWIKKNAKIINLDLHSVSTSCILRPSSPGGHNHRTGY